MSQAFPLLKVDNLSVKRGGRQVIKSFSLCVWPGERIHLCGDNGSGKTTLIEAVLGLIPACEGSVEWCGRPVGNLIQEAGRKGDVVYIPQRNNLFASLSLLENIMVGPGLRSAHKRVLVEFLEAHPELAGALDRRPAQASGGQRQLAAAARVAIRQARLYVLDEPLAGLSPPASDELRQQLFAYTGAEGSCVLVDHSMGRDIDLPGQVGPVRQIMLP